MEDGSWYIRENTSRTWSNYTACFNVARPPPPRPSIIHPIFKVRTWLCRLPQLDMHAQSIIDELIQFAKLTMSRWLETNNVLVRYGPVCLCHICTSVFVCFVFSVLVCVLAFKRRKICTVHNQATYMRLQPTTDWMHTSSLFVVSKVPECWWCRVLYSYDDDCNCYRWR